MFQHGVTKQCSIHPFESSWGLQTGRGTKRPLSELCFSWSYGICHLGHWFCSHHNLEGCVVTVSYLWMGNLISNSGICAASSHVHVVFPCWSSLTPEASEAGEEACRRDPCPNYDYTLYLACSYWWTTLQLCCSHWDSECQAQFGFVGGKRFKSDGLWTIWART
jgi:hypothetical protein